MILSAECLTSVITLIRESILRSKSARTLVSSRVGVRYDDSLNAAVSCRICTKGLDLTGELSSKFRVVNEPVGLCACARDRKMPNNRNDMMADVVVETR